MTSIRKIKRRAMRRMSDPIVELRLTPEVCRVLLNMHPTRRENWVRDAIRCFVKARRSA